MKFKILILLFIYTCAAAQSDSLFQFCQFRFNKKDTLHYRLALPPTMTKNNTYPLVLFLHGIGERGKDNVAQLKHGVCSFVSKSHQQKYPCIVLAPQCPESMKWVNVDGGLKSHIQPDTISLALKAVKNLIDSLVSVLPIDTNRIYITGISMGGIGTWDAITRYPNFFAAAAPVCGGGDETKASRLVNIPIWAFHGANDNVVLTSRTVNMINAIKNKNGKKAQCTIYPNVGHDSWTNTYKEEKLYKWIFKQKKSN